MKIFAFAVFLLIGAVSSTTYLEETFPGTFDWIAGKPKEGTLGTVELSAGKYFCKDQESEGKGLCTKDDAKFYSYARKFDHVLDNKDKTIYIQFQVKHEQDIDCGGGYLKFLPSGTNLKEFTESSKYYIMFGPDICGSDKKTHFILTKGKDDKNHLIKNNLRCESDQLSHLYTLTLKPDNTFVVAIDGEEIRSGSIEDEFDILLPKKIKDPNAKKPSDWEDVAEIDDPEDKKPDDYDSIPSHIPDPKATKPAEWDDEMDGDWEAPKIPNPDFKGEWKPKKIPNPKYKGPWVHPEIDNPDYKPDPELYHFKDIGAVGFDVWQVKSGTIIDNIIVTDEKSVVDSYKDTWKKQHECEVKAKKEIDDAEEEKRKKEAPPPPAKDDEEEDDEDLDEDEKSTPPIPTEEGHDEL